MKNTLIFLKVKYPWREALETQALEGDGGGSWGSGGEGGRYPAQPKLPEKFDCNQSVHQQKLIKCH